MKYFRDFVDSIRMLALLDALCFHRQVCPWEEGAFPRTTCCLTWKLTRDPIYPHSLRDGWTLH